MIKELPSGAKLEVTLAPFKDALNLQKAIAAELKNIKLEGSTNMTDPNFLKDLFCSAMSSDKIIECVEKCFARCTYNGLKITQDTFDSEEARGDYLLICTEVVKENILPFLKGLSSEFATLFQKPSKSM